MSKASRAANREQRSQQNLQRLTLANSVDSLLEAMIVGKEYASIVDKTVKNDFDLLSEVTKGLDIIERIRGKPCLLYAGNVIAKNNEFSGVDATDDLPFQEMVSCVSADQRSIDIFLATNGGSGEQISRFVNCLRARFDEVNFLIPSFCMSAGTLFALSGDNIYMTDNACLGPIDPQVPSVGGRFVPAQALLLLVDQLQKNGDDAMKNGQPVPWTAVRLIDSLDKKELGAAITASQWSKTLAAEYLEKYKFRNWQVRQTSGVSVTPDYRRARAEEVANALVSHEKWKNHGHVISRDILWSEIKLKIEHPGKDLEVGMKKLWALLTWIFDKTPTQKIICSGNYKYALHRVQQVIGGQA